MILKILKHLSSRSIRIALYGILAGVFGWLTNHRYEEIYLYIGMAAVFAFAIELLIWIFKNLI